MEQVRTRCSLRRCNSKEEELNNQGKQLITNICGFPVQEKDLPENLRESCESLDRVLGQKRNSQAYIVAGIKNPNKYSHLSPDPFSAQAPLSYQQKLVERLWNIFLGEIKASYKDTLILKEFTELVKKYKNQEISINILKSEGKRLFKNRESLATFFCSIIESGMTKTNGSQTKSSRKRPRNNQREDTALESQSKSKDRQISCARARSDAVLSRSLPPVLAAREFGATRLDLEKASKLIAKAKDKLSHIPGRYKEFLSVILKAGTVHSLQPAEAEQFTQDLLERLVETCEGAITESELAQFLPHPDFLTKKQKVLSAELMGNQKSGPGTSTHKSNL